MPPDEPFVRESIPGTRIEGRLADTTTVAPDPAVITTITGRAWLTGTTRFFLDPEDPFPEGCYL
ncbi:MULTISPECIES: proline racemase family protein [Streptomyces]|uniref:proline racemase family protein n=1 Tax=Streptomyces lycopersici TaxID=2974589 RepID=UPI0035237D01